MNQKPSNHQNTSAEIAGNQGHLTLRQTISLIVILSGAFMAVMDVFIVNVAIPSIRSSFHVEFASVEFVIAGYGLSYAVMLITGGRLGDMFGRRRMLVTGLVSFAATSALCGLAPTIFVLIGARVAQGLAAALLFPQVLALIRLSFTDARQRSTAFAAFGIALGLSAIAGQILGGILIEADLWGLSWRLVFLINVPFGLAAAVVAPHVVDEYGGLTKTRLDPSGVILSVAGFGTLLYPLVEGREAGWPTWSYAMTGGSVLILPLLFLDQRKKSLAGLSPLIETTLFHQKAFSFGLASIILFYSTVNATYLAYALLIQIGFNRSPTEAGLLLSCNAVAFMAASIAMGRLPDSKKPRLMVLGALLTSLACLMAGIGAWVVTDSNLPWLIVPLALWGVGQGLLMTPLLNVILSGVELKDAGSAAGLVSMTQQVGGSLGIAISGILFFSLLARFATPGKTLQLAYTAGFSASLLYSSVASLLVAGLLRIALRTYPE